MARGVGISPHITEDSNPRVLSDMGLARGHNNSSISKSFFDFVARSRAPTWRKEKADAR